MFQRGYVPTGSNRTLQRQKLFVAPRHADNSSCLQLLLSASWN
jgi:hypothetical protein